MSSSIIEKWHKFPVERKIVISWLIALFIIISVSVLLYISKKEIYNSSNLISQNAELRYASDKLLTSVLRLEINSKRFIITGNKEDSLQYLSNLELLKTDLTNLEALIKSQPSLTKFFIQIQKTIQDDLSKIKYLTLSIDKFKISDSTIANQEERVYKKLDYLCQVLNKEERQTSQDEINLLEAKTDKNFKYFLILVFVYLLLLTILFRFIVSDVKKRRVLAEKVIKSRRELETIINTTPALIFVKDIEKKFTLLNKSFLDFFNIDKEKISFQDNKQLIMQDEKWLADEEDDTIIKNKISLLNIERQTKLADGTVKILNLNKAPILDDNNNVVSIVGVMDDITKRVEFQNELVDSRKKLSEINKQKDKLFSIIAHDLRSPFTGILGFTELLINDFDALTDLEKKQYLQNTYTSMKNVLALIENLLTWARLNLNKVEFNPIKISMAEVIHTVLKTQNVAASIKKIQLESYCNDNIKAFADEDMISTVIRNLVSNAIKFTNVEGIIKVNCFYEGESVKVSVEDNGVGMEPDVANNLFVIDKQRTTNGTNNEKGTGLGLIICKDFIEKNGGKISVVSKVAYGTNISFTLPK
jgi:PAS domain S-box-containing protein